jgi:hypothetical protein
VVAFERSDPRELRPAGYIGRFSANAERHDRNAELPFGHFQANIEALGKPDTGRKVPWATTPL